MKKFLVLAFLFAASATYAPAFAGGCGGGGGGGGGCGGGAASSKGDAFGCSNPCPLAQAANRCRSLGSEAAACSPAVRAALAAAVARNMAKI